MQAHRSKRRLLSALADHALNAVLAGLGLILLIGAGVELAGPVVPPIPKAAVAASVSRAAFTAEPPRPAERGRAPKAWHGASHHASAAQHARPSQHARAPGRASAVALAPREVQTGGPTSAPATPLPHGYGIRVFEVPRAMRLPGNFSFRPHLVTLSHGDSEPMPLPTLHPRHRHHRR